MASPWPQHCKRDGSGGGTPASGAAGSNPPHNPANIQRHCAPLRPPRTHQHLDRMRCTLCRCRKYDDYGKALDLIARSRLSRRLWHRIAYDPVA